ncbi:MAG: hypothetical protein AMXMBFR44_4710 [Candidatus Campbellbacteria bacterium]
MNDIPDTVAPAAPATKAVRTRKKKYSTEVLYAAAGGTFLMGVLLMGVAVSSVRKDIESMALRLNALENMAVTTSEQTASILSSMSEDERERYEQELAFQEQLAALSSNLSSQQSQITTVVQTTDVSARIAAWSPFVYTIECRFTLANGEDDTDRGSATLERTSFGVRLITNKHVIERTDSGVLEECTLSKPDTDTEIEVDAESFVKNEDADYAYAFLSANADAMLFTQRCAQKPAIGDTVLILGYPGIGAKESITATEGIISGFDEDYYTTSAKIEKGNSGGAAIDVKRNCFLGLPTLVFSGRVESLARILPVLGL